MILRRVISPELTQQGNRSVICYRLPQLFGCSMYMGLVMLADRNTHSRTTSAWAECLWVWVGYWKSKKSQITGYGSNPSRIYSGRGVEQFAVRSINVLFLFGIRRNCLRSGRSRSVYLSIRRALEHIVLIIGAYTFCQLHTKFYPTSCCQT